MITRPLFPDEFIKGYLPRTLTECVLSNVDELLPIAGQPAIGCVTGKKRLAAMTSVISALSGVEHGRLVRDHSLAALQKCVVNLRVSSDSTEFVDPEFLWSAAFYGGTARLCKVCVAEDIAEEGLSYWHRSHQIPGIYWCVKHGCPLGERPVHKVSFAATPESVLHEVRMFDTSWVQSLMSNCVIKRYEAVLRLFGHQLSRPLCVTAVSPLLARRAKEMGLRITRNGRRPTLSDFAAANVLHGWMEKTFSVRTKSKPNGEFEDWIDQCLHLRSKPPGGCTYALCLALLWDSPRPAVSLALSEPATEPRTPRRLSEAQIQLILLMWLRNQASMTAIAKELGINREAVSGLLNRLRLPKVSLRQRAAISSAFDKFILDSATNGVRRSDADDAASLPRLFGIAAMAL